MKTLKRWALLAFLALGFVFLTGQAIIDDDDTAASGAGGGGSLLEGSDTTKTGPVRSFGATMIVHAISATAGRCSAIVALVSQDGTHYYTPAQDGSHVVLYDGASGDSLDNGPHTVVVAALHTTVGSIPFPYRYHKLKMYGTVADTIIGLRVTSTPVFNNGLAGDFARAYENPDW